MMNRKHAQRNCNGGIKVVKFDARMLLLLYSITESNISYDITLLPAASPGARSATLRTCKTFHLQSPLSHFANNSIANRTLSKELYCTSQLRVDWWTQMFKTPFLLFFLTPKMDLQKVRHVPPANSTNYTRQRTIKRTIANSSVEF